MIVLLTACVPQFSDALPEVLPPANPTQAFEVKGKTFTYASSDENFINPERGFDFGKQIMQTEDYTFVRKGGASVLFGYVGIGNFRYSSISNDFLSDLRRRLDKARDAGIKLVLRFYYTFGPGEDAPLNRVLEHINQLKPIFSDYQDIILTVQGGFIGAWGEWHDSSNNLDNPATARTISEALLAAVPKERMVQLRYVQAIARMYPSPLASNQAYSGSNQARIGLHNDCFLSNGHDAGTYRFPSNERNEDQAYLEQLSQFTPIGGETCEVSPDTNTPYTRAGCATAVSEMRRFNWSFISGTWYGPIIERWKLEGCYDLIARRLGYRLRLVKAVIPEEVAKGENLKLMLEVANEGFAAPFNRRPAQIILRNKASKATVALPLNTDPRRFSPGKTTSVYADLALPGSLPAGTYDILLNLPDLFPRLASRPEYSIRLANPNVWEASTGYNALQASVKLQ